MVERHPFKVTRVGSIPTGGTSPFDDAAADLHVTVLGWPRPDHRAGALVHLDLGTSDDDHNARLLAEVSPLLVPLVASGGIIVSNFRLSVAGWDKIAEPPGVKPGRYFLYRAG